MTENIKIPDNFEIDQALKEFEAKSKAEETQKVSEVSKTPDVPKMVRLVMKLSGGAIKEQKQAEYVLLGFVALAIIVSLFLVFGGKQTQQKLTPVMLEQIKQMHINQ